MDPVKEHQDVLQNIESVIVEQFRRNPQLIDYDVRDALDAALRWCRTPDQEHAEKYRPTPERPRTVYDAIVHICEYRMGRGEPLPERAGVISEEVMTACLRKLRKSVEFWTKKAGRQGYLNYVDQFL